MITETPDVQTWLDDAARAWPDDAANRAALLRRLLASGHEKVDAMLDDVARRRRDLVRAASGSMAGVWPAGWYEQYKQDEWPA